MTRYIVACPTQVYGDRLILRPGDGGDLWSVPLKCFVTDEPVAPAEQVKTMGPTLSAHRFGAILDKANIRIRELEREIVRLKGEKE